MRDATDEFLMSRVAEFGDERALSELYDRYGGLIHGARMRYLGDRTLAEDLVQAVEQHLAGCATCRDEECGLRETHERFAGASIAAASAPPDSKRVS